MSFSAIGGFSNDEMLGDTMYHFSWRGKMESLQVITARVPEHTFSLLNELAEELRAARGTVIRNCLEDYLADWADYQIAKKRFDDANDEILNAEAAGEYLRGKGWDV